MARRRALGFTQLALARRASISLATLQKIEAGKVSPRWENVAAIMDQLGLEIEFPEQQLDLDTLVDIGVPLSGQINKDFFKNTNSLSRDQTIERIAQVLHKALILKPKLELRVLEALSAYLFSIKTYYPSAYRNLLVLVPDAAALISKSPISLSSAGRLIKLSRLSKSLLSNIL